MRSYTMRPNGHQFRAELGISPGAPLTWEQAHAAALATLDIERRDRGHAPRSVAVEHARGRCAACIIVPLWAASSLILGGLAAWWWM